MTPLFNPQQPPMHTGTAPPALSSSGGPASSLPPPMTFRTQDIHTMPGRFSGSAKPAGSGKPVTSFVIIGALALCVAVGGVLLYLRLSASMKTNTTTNANTNTAQTNVNSAAANVNATNGNVNAANANANTNSALPTTVTGSLLDADTNEVLGSLTATFPVAALPSTVQKVSVVALSPTIGAYATAQEYVAVGGVFLIAATPSTTTISKNASLELTYTDRALLNLNIVVKESTLKAAAWNGSDWALLDGSTVDAAKNTVTVDIGKLYPDGIAIVAPAPVSANANSSSNLNANQSIGTTIVPSKDGDTDGLTDQEELLYGTNAINADTDGDGYKDGQEVQAQYDPTRGSGAKLADSGLIKTYTNTTYQYSMLYPSSWVVGTMNADKLVLFTSITGEFLQVSVQENTSGVSARQWYLTTNSSVSSSSLKDIAVGNLTGIIGPDNLNIFLADKTRIYQLTYNIGIKSEANYLTTFTTMYTSFLTGVIGSGTNSNSNVNANSNANKNSNSNSNVNANTNANTNSNSNTNS